MTLTKAVSRRLALPAGLALCLIATAAFAQAFSREQDIADLRLGQRVLVDDGSCPVGQIKEVQGSQMTTAGIVRTGSVERGAGAPIAGSEVWSLTKNLRRRPS